MIHYNELVALTNQMLLYWRKIYCRHQDACSVKCRVPRLMPMICLNTALTICIDKDHIFIRLLIIPLCTFSNWQPVWYTISLVLLKFLKWYKTFSVHRLKNNTLLFFIFVNSEITVVSTNICEMLSSSRNFLANEFFFC